MIKVKNIAKAIEEVAPKFLQEDYDNVGLMVGDNNKIVKKVLFSLDCTKEVLKEAVNIKADLIVTHHPLFFRKPKNIIKGDLVGDKVITLIKEDIALYSCHTNLDSARNGLNETIVKILGFNSSKIIEPVDQESYGNCGIGRIVKLENEILFSDIVELVKRNLNVKSMRIVKG